MLGEVEGRDTAVLSRGVAFRFHGFFKAFVVRLG